MLRHKKVSVNWRENKRRWEVSFYWEGKRYRKASWILDGTKLSFSKENKFIAEEFANHIRSRMRPNRKGVVTFDPAELTTGRKIKNSLEAYSKIWLLDYRQKVKTSDRSREYVKHLERYLRLHILPVLGDTDIREISEMPIKEFYLGLFEKGLAKKSISNIMDALKKILTDAFDDHVITEHTRFPKYKPKKNQRKHVKTLTDEEQDLVLRFAPERHRPIYRCYFYDGLRQIEVRNLKREDVDLEQGIAHVRTAKGGPDRDILLEPETLADMRKIIPCIGGWMYHNNGRKYSKSTFWKYLRPALDEAGFKDVTPNQAGRHSAASNLDLRGMPTRQIQEKLGHADIRTTMIYTHSKLEGQRRYMRCRSGVGHFEGEVKRKASE